MIQRFARRPKRLSLEDQLAVFSACGVMLNDGRTIEELLVSARREDFESEPLLMLAIVLGSEVETEPSPGCFTDQLWHFDIECIEDHGDNARIAHRMGDARW